MQTFTGLEYIMISIANAFGLDKLVWKNRIFWVRNNEPDLEKLANNAKHPHMYSKAVRAFRRVSVGLPTDFMINLDATASGVQIMSAMSGCIKGGKAVNLVNTEKREDLYSHMANIMSEICGYKIDAATIKKPVMTFFYGSTAKPKEIFGEDTPELAAFYQTLEEGLPGAYNLRNILIASWDPRANAYEWAMPDGHYAYVPVVVPEEKGLEIDEADHLRFTMRTLVCKPKEMGLALAANVVHSVDAWIGREMVKRSKEQGFNVIPIHDCFFCTPNNGNNVRYLYREIMADVAEQNLVTNILSQIYDTHFPYAKLSSDLPRLIRKSEYALS